MPDDGNGLTFLEIEKKAKRMYRDHKITYKEYMVIHHRNIKNMQNLKEQLETKVKELNAKKAEKDSQEVSENPM